MSKEHYIESDRLPGRLRADQYRDRRTGETVKAAVLPGPIVLETPGQNRYGLIGDFLVERDGELEVYITRDFFDRFERV